MYWWYQQLIELMHTTIQIKRAVIQLLRASIQLRENATPEKYNVDEKWIIWTIPWNWKRSIYFI